MYTNLLISAFLLAVILVVLHFWYKSLSARAEKILLLLVLNQVRWTSIWEILEVTEEQKSFVDGLLVFLLDKNILRARDKEGTLYEDTKVWYSKDITPDLEVQINRDQPRRRKRQEKEPFFKKLFPPIPVPA